MSKAQIIKPINGQINQMDSFQKKHKRPMHTREMLDTLSHQGNANVNHTRDSNLAPFTMGSTSRQPSTNTGKDTGGNVPVHTVGRNEKEVVLILRKPVWSKDELLPHFGMYRRDAKSAHNTSMLLSTISQAMPPAGATHWAGEMMKET